MPKQTFLFPEATLLSLYAGRGRPPRSRHATLVAICAASTIQVAELARQRGLKVSTVRTHIRELVRRELIRRVGDQVTVLRRPA